MFITTDEIFEEFEELDPRDQSQYLLELGFDLPRFSADKQRAEDLVHGCQSQVWLTVATADSSAVASEDPVLAISADSDAEIVRGLITILLASYEGKTATEILSFSITDVFDRLHLKQYISPQRHNGLQGMVDKIRQQAAMYATASEMAASSDDVATPADVVSANVVTSSTTAADANVPLLPFDAEVIRSQFPALNQELEPGIRPVFLDSGASAQKPQVVIDKQREVEEQYFANAYRGRYSFGARVDEELEAARQKVASFINAASPQQISFTPGCTATLNMVAFGWGLKHLAPGDEILITEMEHHANFVPWQQLALKTQAELRFIPLTSDGRLDLEQLDSVLTAKTKIVAVTGMSNVLGTVNPIAELAKRAHDVGAIIVVDGAQSVPHMPIDVVVDDVDFLVFSGHKVYGPTGVGILYGKPERLEETDATVFGGHMISRVYKDHSTWAPAPAKFEAGTLPIVQAIAMGTAIDWVQSYGLQAIHDHEQHLLKLTTERLQQIPGMKIYGPDIKHKGAIISFRIDKLHPEDLSAMLDRHGVMTRHGHHCTMPLHDLLGVSATTRASFAAYNTEADVTALVDAIEYARKQLRLV